METAEVEAALAACPLVRQVVVTAGEFSGNDVMTLAAYVVPAARPDGREGTEPDAATLRGYLANHLPAYAIPAFFIPMASLPMTPSGKVDRKSLPSPVTTKGAGARGRAPEGPTETALAGLWSDLLGRVVTDAEADFFALGGHSVLGVRLASLIEAQFGRRLPLSALFSHATVAAQAGLLESPEDAESGEARILPLCPEDNGRGMPLFLFHPAGGSAYCYRALAERLGAEFPVPGGGTAVAAGPLARHAQCGEMVETITRAASRARWRTWRTDGPIFWAAGVSAACWPLRRRGCCAAEGCPNGAW